MQPDAGGGDRLAVDVVGTSPAANTPSTLVRVDAVVRDSGSRSSSCRASRGRAPVFGSWPMATNKPLAVLDPLLAGVDVPQPDADDLAVLVAEHLLDQRSSVQGS